MKRYQIEADLFHEGYPEFSEEAVVYDTLCGKLSETGYTAEEAGKLEADFQSREQELRRIRREAAKEKRIGERLLRKVFEKEENLEKAARKKRLPAR